MRSMFQKKSCPRRGSFSFTLKVIRREDRIRSDHSVTTMLAKP